MSDFLVPARHSMERVRRAISNMNLNFVDLPPGPVGLGLALAFGETSFIVLTVMGPPNENQVTLTTGVLRDVTRDRPRVLDECNRRTADNPSLPFFLHDAESGWDVLLQNIYPLQLLLDVPQFFESLVHGLPAVGSENAGELAQTLGGAPYRWHEDDIERLYLRSML